MKNQNTRRIRQQERLLREAIQLHLSDMRDADLEPRSRMRRLRFNLKEGAGLLPRQIVLSEEYIVGVLGIDARVLRESINDHAYQMLILREHLILEGWFDSVKDKVKELLKDNPVTNAYEAAKEMGDNVKAVVASLTSIVSTGGDAIDTVVSGAKSLLSKNVSAINKGIATVAKRIKELAGKLTNSKVKDFVEGVFKKISDFKQFIVDKISDAMGAGGWKGMFASLAVYLASVALRPKVDEIAGKLSDVLSGDPKKIAAVAGGIAKEAAGDALGGDEEEGEPPPEAEGEEGEIAKAIDMVKKAVVSYVWGMFKKVIGAAGAEAVEQLAGPLGYVKKLGEIFQKIAGGTSWVCEKILDAIGRATFRPLGSAPAAS